MDAATFMGYCNSIRTHIGSLMRVASKIKTMDGPEIRHALNLAESAVHYASLIHLVIDPSFPEMDAEQKEKIYKNAKAQLRTMDELLDMVHHAPYGGGANPPLELNALSDFPSSEFGGNVIPMAPKKVNRKAGGGSEPAA